VAIAGPLQGTILPLGEAETSIGRKSGNTVAIGDDALSRRHCAVRQQTSSFVLRDLESRNGTFVNGLPVQERVLEHGDQIRAGISVFLFLVGEEVPQAEDGPVEMDDEAVISGPTARLRREDSIYLQPEKAVASLADSRVARDLEALLKIGGIIHSIPRLTDLARQLIRLIFEVIPAQRGALFLAVHEGEWDAIASHTAGCEGGKVVVSRTVLRQVREEGVALLRNNVLENAEFQSSVSLEAAHVNCLLAVPLELHNRVTGAIYLDSSAAENPFDEGHLELISGIAGVAAPALENARRVDWLERENERLNAEILVQHNMVGESAKMRGVHQFIARVSAADATVLIRGESGTGKELVARAIHTNSRRAGKPFVAINCAALTETLLESELFGHEKGAFTGASAQKRGKLEAAEGGTVFLDELGEMTPPLQVKLLRVLQEREFERVGGTRTVRVDIRVIAATNRDLEAAIAAGRFRQDLFYRLNVVSVTMPPLRERREDIGLLASYFTARYAAKCARKITGISPEARALLASYDWPGNVRELENAIERAIVLGSDDLIHPEDLPESLLESDSGVNAGAGTKFHDAVKETKKQLIVRAVEQSGGSYTEAARVLGLHPNYLHRLIRNLNLKAALKARGA
jgi:Nif-specific regulatory protein